MTKLPFPGARPRRAWAFALILCAATALVVGWNGYSASDDAFYYQGAVEWLTDPPYPGHDHWTTRHPLEVTLALAIGLLGRGYAAMAMLAVGWYIVFVATTFWLARRIGGERPAWIAAIIMGTLPVVIANATTVSCDLTEAVFLMIGIGLAGDLATGRQDRWRAIAAGLAFGGAILCRETTGLALFGFVPIFLTGRPIPRPHLVWMGLALAGLIGLEALYQGALTGDPFNRWALAFHHDSHIDRTANEEGNVLLWAPIDPLLVLLVNDDFTILFWIAGVALALGFPHGLGEATRHRLLVLFAPAFASFFLVGALYTKLVLNPRYFMLAAICAAVSVALWLDHIRRVPRLLTLAAMVAANLLLLGLNNAHPRWNVEALVRAAAAHPGELVHTDPETFRRAEYPLQWERVRNVTDAPAAPGALLVGRADALAVCPVVAHHPSPPTFWGGVAQRLGLARWVPRIVARRLLAPSPEMVLVRCLR